MHTRRVLPAVAAVLLVFGLNQSLSAQRVNGSILAISMSTDTLTTTRFRSEARKEHFGNYRFACARPLSPFSA